MKKVGIIGAGKIGGSLLLRLAESGGFDLGVSDIHPEQLSHFRKIGVRTTSSNRELAEESDLLIVAVKPWDVTQVMEEISASFEASNKAVTSVAAGVSIERISECMPPGTAILRVMPNVCASVGLGSAVVTANEAGRAALPTVVDIFRHVGEVQELPERLFDAATALHGSGPAYVALFADALIQAGVREGIPRDVAQTAGGRHDRRDGGAAERTQRPPGARRGDDARRHDGRRVRRDGEGRVRGGGLRRGGGGHGEGEGARRMTVALLQQLGFSVAGLLAGGGQLRLLHTFRVHHRFDPLLVVPRLPFEQVHAGGLRRRERGRQPDTDAHKEPHTHAEARGFRHRPLPDNRHPRALDRPEACC